MEFKIAWSARLSREASDGDLTAADASLMSDVSRALSGISCAIRVPVVLREVFSHADVTVDADSYEDAEAAVRRTLEGRFCEAGLSVDGLEID